jgi:ectoine hydroxylase-related dioxygenase (phytanoyl-CoA dioxygenase family)
MNQGERDFFAQNGFLNLGQCLDKAEIEYFHTLYEQDRQTKFDELIRHPKILPTVEALMAGPLCFGEIGLRWMGPYDGQFHQGWHRDKPHWLEHPLRMDYIQLIVYLSDVSADTHCFSISPEALDQPILKDHREQLARGGVYDLHGPAGTCALFNVSVLHTATTRPTQAIRKTAQIYYGHRHRPYLANDSGIPATFWRDHPDAETRAFYGVLNERTRTYMAAFG